MRASARRRLLLAAAFAAALASAVLATSREASSPQRAATSPPASGAAVREERKAERAVEVPPVADYRRPAGEGVAAIDLFEPRLPPSPPPPPPAAPSPPKLSFSYIGYIQESEGPVKAVLAEGDQLHIVAQGGRYRGTYLLETVGAEELVVTYLPLGARQSLPTGTPK